MNIINTFARQAIPMVWDFAEANPFADAVGDFGGNMNGLCESYAAVPSGKFPGSCLAEQ